MPQEEEGQPKTPERGLVGLPQRVHETSRQDLLKGLLDPLTIDNPAKADIWDRVFGSQYSNQDLQGLLDPLTLDETTKADIWDIRNRVTGHLPAAAIPKAEAPAPGQPKPPAEIPAAPTGFGELPTAPDRVGVGPLGPRVPASWPPEGRVPYEVAKSREERALAGAPTPPPEPLELITPRLKSGYSEQITLPGIGPGRFNFNEP